MPKRTEGKRLTKARVVEAAIIAAGFIPAGSTPIETVRSGSASSPVYGGMGGKLVTTGGRKRFEKPGTQMKVTVGQRTVCFYEVVKGNAENYQCFPTGEIDLIEGFLAGLFDAGRTALKTGAEE